MDDQEITHQLDLPLIGQRAYVRATDIVSAVIMLFPNQELSFIFRRPLRGPGRLVRGKTNESAVTVLLAGREQINILPTRERVERQAVRQPEFSPRYIRIGKLYFLITRKGGSVLDRIDYVFDRLHPKMSNKLLIAEFQYYNPSSVPRLMWSWLRYKDCEVHINIRSLRGRVASTVFVFRRHKQTGCSIAPNSPKQVGFARQS